jgi:DNA-binding transcriptional MocR family regulator
VEKLKFLNTLNTPALPQLAIAEYLQNDGYDYHLRKVRKAYAQQASIMASAVRRFFPAGTSVSTPAGGYVLWVNLPDGVRALELYARAQERGISVGAGNIHRRRLPALHPPQLQLSMDAGSGSRRADTGPAGGELATSCRIYMTL